MTMAVKTRIDRMKLNTGPAATVAARAQSGAPCIVCRRSPASSEAITASSALSEVAEASPRNFT
jgi:hypothetical protein